MTMGLMGQLTGYFDWMELAFYMWNVKGLQDAKISKWRPCNEPYFQICRSLKNSYTAAAHYAKRRDAAVLQLFFFWGGGWPNIDKNGAPKGRQIYVKVKTYLSHMAIKFYEVVS